MKTTIYYFSGTGNTLSVAKKIQTMLGDVQLIPIAKVLGEVKHINAVKIGFLFPIYAWGMPRIVTEFIEQVSFSNTEYCFSISTGAGTVGKTHVVLSEKLKKKGVKLNAGIALAEPNNALDTDESGLLHRMVVGNRGKREHLSIEQRFSELEIILKGDKQHILEKDSWFSNFLGNESNKYVMRDLFPKQSKNFWVNDECTGCGICVKVCARKNIKICKKRPVWSENCEYCLACLHWCPKKALQSGNSTEGQSRYTKEGIKMSEII